MNYEVEFTATAKADLLETLRYIALDNPRRALSFIEQLESRIRRKLEIFPLSGTAIGRHRFSVFDGYVAVYAVDESTRQVFVVMVAEGHRNWRGYFD